ncbi:hypothetical protein BJF79_33900 [Actinomadura sp. CNU-125]|uniref:hypothetical protein n=1 Tax=Actinomadura sp. CNU-125 TaxID=1904961 RepID=UPI000966C0A0|nr:hypothetical protein [Actinomadura sp. CNU-125]OLT34023.1 hypothetical protein BJF79_33900 [Actinomadura sp. CNU-125]
MKRALAAVPFLTIALALTGCGGSDEAPEASGTDGSGSSAPATSASAAPRTGDAPATGGTSGSPDMSNAAKELNDCMAEQGVDVPTPTPGSTPSKEQMKRVMKAMEVCAKKFSTDPPSAG